MATRLEVEYDRQFANADVQAIIARGTVTINVLHQLGAAYHTCPDC